MGEGLQNTQQISDRAFERNLIAIHEMVKMANQFGADEIVAVGTMALRTAKNANNFINQVKEQCGITIEIIPGEEEARLSFLAPRCRRRRAHLANIPCP